MTSAPFPQLDAFILYEAPANCAIFLNDGGTFREWNTTLPPSGQHAFGDYDGDGDLDVLASVVTCDASSGGCKKGVQLYRNNGDATFAKVVGTTISQLRESGGDDPLVFADIDGVRIAEIEAWPTTSERRAP